PEPNYEADRVAVEDGGQSEEALHARGLGPDDIAWPADIGAEEDGAIVQAA
ncbi:unnamed protein product, partial [Prorocentrum cordatum]